MASNPLADLMGLAVAETLGDEKGTGETGIGKKTPTVVVVAAAAATVVGDMLGGDDDEESDSDSESEEENGEQELDRVMLNPHAVRLGLTKARSPEKRVEQTANACVNSLSHHRREVSAVDVATSEDMFGIKYDKIRVPGEATEGYSLPSGPAFGDEKEFEADLLESNLLVQEDDQASDDDDEFDFDVGVELAVSSTPVSATPPRPPPSAIPPTSSALSQSIQGQLVISEQAFEKVQPVKESIPASSAEALLKMHLQYAAGLTDEEAALQKATDAKAFKKAIDIHAPLGDLVEGDEEEEEEEEESEPDISVKTANSNAPGNPMSAVELEWASLTNTSAAAKINEA